MVHNRPIQASPKNLSAWLIFVLTVWSLCACDSRMSNPAGSSSTPVLLGNGHGYDGNTQQPAPATAPAENPSQSASTSPGNPKSGGSDSNQADFSTLVASLDSGVAPQIDLEVTVTVTSSGLAIRLDWNSDVACKDNAPFLVLKRNSSDTNWELLATVPSASRSGSYVEPTVERQAVIDYSVGCRGAIISNLVTK